MVKVLDSDTLQSKISDMDAIFHQILLLLPSLAFAIPVLDSGEGVSSIGPEPIVTDFAVLAGNNLANLPPDLTICSSLASGPFGLYGPLSSFQLLYQDGKPWVSIYIYPPQQKDTTHHRMTFSINF